MMHIGMQLHAPKGFESLEMGRIAHFLRNDQDKNQVLLVEFLERPIKKMSQKNRTPVPIPIIRKFDRNRFEQALLRGDICPVARQRELPPWFGDLTSTMLKGHSESQKKNVTSHKVRMDKRLKHITPLLENMVEVLSLPDPKLAIGKYARKCTPPQNSTRLCCDFFAYLLYGQNQWVFHYRINHIGRWDRSQKPDTKVGAKSKARGASGYGTNDPAMIAKIEEGYRAHSGPGIPLNKIYSYTMTKQFGCKTMDVGNNQKRFYQPDGLPFPSPDQFHYRIDQLFDLKERKRHKYGAAISRNQSAPKGKYIESVSSVMERIEADGYWVKDICEGFLKDSYLPQMVVVNIRDVASGMKVGIGFSLDGEKASAYRMAQFCMAIDKVKFCALFGIEIKPWEWPSVGISPNKITDRGSGMTADAESRTEAGLAMIREGAPAYMGQSKAIVESSNPRKVDIEGKPTYTTTNLTLPQLARREIYNLLKFNSGSNAGDRLNNKAIIERVGRTPVDVWGYLDERARTYAVPMTFDEAVRSFLTPVTVKSCPYGVEFHGQPYDSKKLRGTELHEEANSHGGVEIQAYMLDACVRHLWVEYGGELIEVDAQLKIDDGDDQLYVSVLELEQINTLRHHGEREYELHTRANSAAWNERYHAQTGIDLDQGTRKSGRPKRKNAASRQEREQVLPYLQAGRRKK